MELANKVAIITGGGSGIGKAISTRFAKEGAKVVIIDLNLERAIKAAEEIASQGGETFPLAVDVTKEDQVEKGFEQVIEKYQYVDIAVCNAGIQRVNPIDKLSLEDWKAILDSHLDGSFLITRSSLKHMYATGRGGSIIFTGSVHSKIASPQKGPYTAAKHGLAGLCKAVAKEGGKFGVRANIICPGFVLTPPLQNQIRAQAAALGISEEELKMNMLKETVDGEFTKGEEIAEVALFFASFKSCALTGQSLNVSHGWVMD